MTVKSLPLTLAVLLALGAGGVTAQDKVGTVHFPTTCSAAVQGDFVRAVAMLHSFWFSASPAAFAAVAQAAPGCGIAHWGVAMNLLGNPFGWPPSPKALADGWAAVERAKTAGAKTQRERDYIAAIETFYKDADTVDHRTRALGYRQAMEQLTARYPDDREAAVFYALALNATALPTDKTYADQLKAAGILEKVFAAEPQHPGVAHYLIHSYDYPPIAQKGLSAARRYSDIAPSAAHALHMPSHIFTRVGAWEDSLAANLRSEANARQNKAAQDTLHALDYQVYAALQLARDGEVRGALERIAATVPNPDQRASYYAQAASPARYALERGDWKLASGLEVRQSAYLYAAALTNFARGYGAARLGDSAGAEREAAELGRLQKALEAQNDKYWSTEVEAQRLSVVAWSELARGNRDAALAQMHKAADLEETSEKSPVSPGRLLPARELLGEMLLQLNRPAEALKEFEASAARDPNRFRGYYGAGLAAQGSGDTAKARGYFTKLSQLAAKGDPRPELAQARTFLAVN